MEGKRDDDFPLEKSRIIELLNGYGMVLDECTNGSLLDLRETAFARLVTNGSHVDYAPNESVPYEYTPHLNFPKYGSYGKVTKVLVRGTELARKMLYHPEEERVERERSVMAGLLHPHILEMHASYATLDLLFSSLDHSASPIRAKS
jgi:hypothetical protein